MIIHARVVEQRVNHFCEACMKEIEGLALRVYGAAHRGDKPYRIYSHIDCAKPWKDPKIQRALRRVGR